MNSYGVGGVGSGHAMGGTAERPQVSQPNGKRRSSALPDPSLYDTYAREQSPLSDEEMREAAAFHFGVALDAS